MNIINQNISHTSLKKKTK